MSPMEIVIYSILGLVLAGLMFKWIVYDKFIKPKKADKKKIQEQESQDLDHENKE